MFVPIYDFICILLEDQKKETVENRNEFMQNKSCVCVCVI